MLAFKQVKCVQQMAGNCGRIRENSEVMGKISSVEIHL
jgi:hypothetical protein